MPYGFRNDAAEHATNNAEYLRTSGQRLRPKNVSTVLPATSNARHARKTRNPPCRFVQIAVTGTSSQTQRVFFRRSASINHRQAGASIRVNRCGRARKWIVELPTARNVTKAASNAFDPRQIA